MEITLNAHITKVYQIDVAKGVSKAYRNILSSTTYVRSEGPSVNRVIFLVFLKQPLRIKNFAKYRLYWLWKICNFTIKHGNDGGN